MSNPDNPYRQSYTYNAWNNMGRTGKHWSAQVSDTPTYTNNRRADLNFDANGSVTSDNNYETHAYDAANQQINFHTAEAIYPGGGAWIFNEYTITHTYDGNGQAGKRVETRSSEDSEGGPIESSTETSYNLRSTVLGGALIAKLNQWGGRDEGHIYAGGEEIASYFNTAQNTYTQFRHTNPVTGNWVKTWSNADAVRTELDPLGADMSTTNPYLSNLSYADIMGSDNLYYLRGNALDIRGGCALDGMPIPCSQANEAKLLTGHECGC